MTETRKASTSLTDAHAPVSREIVDGCQLMAGGAGGTEPFLWALRRGARLAWLFVRHLPSRLRARIALRTRLRAAFGRASKSTGDRADATRDTSGRVVVSDPRGPGPPAASERAAAIDEFQPGDWVRVRTLAEIERTLDAWGCCHHCGFMSSMARWCGQRLRVVRRVDRFFDEARHRMVRCRGVILLEGVYCDGSHHPDLRGCDRQCYCFWRVEWVERASAPEQD